MTRLSPPLPASSVRCRHCGGAHLIEHCPRVLLAFAPDATPECGRCGAPVDHHARTRLCSACLSDRRREMAENRPHRLGAQAGRGEYVVVHAPPGSDYRVGARLLAVEQAAAAGVLDLGMMLRRVEWQRDRSRALYYVVAHRDDGGQRLNQVCGPSWLRRAHRQARCER